MVVVMMIKTLQALQNQKPQGQTETPVRRSKVCGPRLTLITLRFFGFV
jgi:hypothetical protein